MGQKTNGLLHQTHHNTTVFQLSGKDWVNVDIKMAIADWSKTWKGDPRGAPPRIILIPGKRIITRISKTDVAGFNKYLYFEKIHAKIGAVMDIRYAPAFFPAPGSPWVYEVLFDIGGPKGEKHCVSEDWVERFDKKTIPRRRILIEKYGPGPDRWWGISRIIPEMDRR